MPSPASPNPVANKVASFPAARLDGQAAASPHNGDVALHKVPSHDFFHRKSQVSVARGWEAVYAGGRDHSADGMALRRACCSAIMPTACRPGWTPSATPLPRPSSNPCRAAWASI